MRAIKWWLSGLMFCAGLLAGITLAGAAEPGAKPAAKTSCPAKSERTKPVVKMQTNFGSFTIELYADKAPETVANFLDYVESGFYNGTVFHRVIDGFMIQGGGFEPGMTQKKTKPTIRNEADNGLKNTSHTIAMARTPDPHSASSQFFINVADNDFLDFRAPTPQGYGYCVFGKVVEGTEVVDKIKGVRTGNKAGHQNVPLEDVVIEKAEKC